MLPKFTWSILYEVEATTNLMRGIFFFDAARFIRVRVLPGGDAGTIFRWLLQFRWHLEDAVVKLGEHLARLLAGDFVAEHDGARGRNSVQHRAVFAVHHDAQQFAGPGKDEVAAGGVEFAEKTLD